MADAGVAQRADIPELQNVADTGALPVSATLFDGRLRSADVR